MPKPIYLYYNATTPHDPQVIEAMQPFLEVCDYLEKKGVEVTYVPVEGQGMVSVSAVEAATDSVPS
ncbi:MAG: hypothetical protein WBM69_13810 [Desulfobacterales bacterium]